MAFLTVNICIYVCISHTQNNAPKFLSLSCVKHEGTRPGRGRILERLVSSFMLVLHTTGLVKTFSEASRLVPTATFEFQLHISHQKMLLSLHLSSQFQKQYSTKFSQEKILVLKQDFQSPSHTETLNRFLKYLSGVRTLISMWFQSGLLLRKLRPPDFT